LLEELLGGSHIPVLRERRVHEIVIPVDCSVKIAPSTVDLAVGFINIPRPTHLTLAPGA
jgi:hypothetical protein